MSYLKRITHTVGTAAPWCALFLGIVLTCLVWDAARDSAFRRHEQRFAIRAEHARSDLLHRLQRCEDAVRDARLIFLVSESVEPEEWCEFVVGLDLKRNCPGLIHLAYFDAEPSGDGVPNNGGLTWRMRYGESTDAASIKVFERRVAAYLASRPANGDGAFSVIAQADQRPLDLLLLLSVAPKPQEGPAEHTLGWVAGCVDLAELTGSVLGATDSLVQLRLFQYGQEGEPRLLFQTPPPDRRREKHELFSSRAPLNWRGGDYVLEVSSLPDFEAKMDSFWPLVVFVAGLLASGLLFLLVWLTHRMRSIAENLADEMTAALRARERQLEEYAAQLKQANECLEAYSATVLQANRAKSESLANTSHELRTPLTAILGFAELLRHEGEVSPAMRQEAAAAILRNGDHLLQILNDLLDLSKIEAGRLRVYRQRCCLSQLLDDVARMAETRSQSKRIRFAVDRVGELPVTITTDPVRLRQILINLVGNAVKFTSAGGVWLRVRRLETAGLEARLEFAVIDTGIGMKPEQLQNLFRRFVQGGAEIQRLYGGNGLGLAISHRLAELLGGALEAESEWGKGSTFRLTLPVGRLDATAMIGEQDESEATGAATETSAADSPPRAPGDVRVLLAEDGPDNQRFISLILSRAGYTVATADDGQKAVDAVQRAADEGRPFDLVLMDMEMPVLSGFDATRRLRAAGHRTPIVALTARAMPEDSRRCLAAGCDAYATKPIRRDALLELVASNVAAGGRPTPCK